MSVRRLVLVVFAMFAIVPATASARVRVVKSASGSPGSYATLSVSASPSATCSIVVMYKSGSSHAKGLGSKHGSTISWTWMIGTRTTPGRWPIYISCGRAGTITSSIRVS
jgi:hypothetical protein